MLERPNQKIVTVFFAVIFGGVIALAAARFPAESLPSTPGRFIGFLFVSLLYLLSHVLRAARLAVISTSLLGTSFRTVFSMHFFIAPWSLILPWKLDELIRLLELSNVGRSFTRGVAVIVIDRTIDGVILLAASLWVMANASSHSATVGALAGMISVLIALGIFAAPPILLTIQRYIFTYHYKPRAISVLRFVHYVRQLSESSYATIVNMFLVLALCTFGIWILELMSVAVFMILTATDQRTPVGLTAMLEFLLSRVDLSWAAPWASRNDTPQGVVSIITLFSLSAAWIPFSYYYALRRKAEMTDGSYLMRGPL